MRHWDKFSGVLCASGTEAANNLSQWRQLISRLNLRYLVAFKYMYIFNIWHDIHSISTRHHMNRVADILKLADEAKQQNVDAVLATVVHTEGSAYRQAGAMMLICEDGRSVGMISGGCLEPHIIKRAFWLTRDGATVQVYQTGDEQTDDSEDGLTTDINDDSFDQVSFNQAGDDELNFGLGCNGKVHVLFERLSSAVPLLDLIQQVRQELQPITVATLIRSNNSKLSIGTRVKLDATTLGDSRIVAKEDRTLPIFDSLIKILSKHKVSPKNADYVILENNDLVEARLQNEKLKSEWLIQRLQPQPRLLICGAGNDVIPLVTMAKLQDWHVTVIDSRAQYATSTRFAQADVVMQVSLQDKSTLLKLSDNAAVALMSHSLSQDRARLAILLAHSSQCRYLGQLGPRYRTERLLKEISAAHKHPEILTEGIHRLHYPIGYKLGGDGPEALALSIMAQTSAVIHNQTDIENALMPLTLLSVNSQSSDANALTDKLTYEG